MQRPFFIRVSEDAPKLAKLAADLERRYDRDYQVMAAPSASGALQRLGDLAEADAEVALFIADERLTEMPAVDFLAGARELHPRAKPASGR